MVTSLFQLICALLVPIGFITAVTLGALWHYGISLHYAIFAPFATFLFLYILIAILFRTSAYIQRCMVYLANAKSVPPDFDFGDPVDAGLAGCRNFYLFPRQDEYMGVWHLLPHSLIAESAMKPRQVKFWEDCLRDSGKHVVIYFHGNTGTRALDHRKELYWLLQNQEFHVLSFDYRGFADSHETKISEHTTVEDGLAVIRYVRGILGPESQSEIFIWGHSLGTGISSHVVAKLHLEEEGIMPAGFIMEAPFTNLGDAMKCNGRALMYRILPFFDHIFVKPLRKNGFAYDCDVHIKNIHIPILILHAVDDATIPYRLGHQVFEIGLTERPREAKPIFIKQFPKGHGHKLIHTSPELPYLIRDYTRACILDEWANFTL